MKSAILGKKIGMTSIFDDKGVQVPCTVIEAGPCPVVNIRTGEQNGYNAIQLGWLPVKETKVNKPVLGYFKKQGINPVKYLKEFRDLEANLKIGENVTVEQFQAGDKVKVVGKSKGKGFQGVIKRHHFGGVGMQTHGQSDRQRHPGSIGSSSYPSRVFKGLKMAGRMGGKQITTRNLQILEVMPEKNLILIKGNVPGANNSLLEIVKL
ncbi:MAG TPA: 50S ribosomal protein L3 [Candidatus Kapabacteria bacterium]|nr:50S ribosomal protein L3 [Candidatus Kapabacteria bacterium]